VIPIRDTPNGATFAVRVQPRARKNAILGEIGEALKLALTAPPVEGRANDACIAFLAEFLKVPSSSVTIAAGQTSRNKVVRVAGKTAADIARRLRSATEECGLTVQILGMKVKGHGF
jgi:uncharacterized protein (TIGR00251 family)